MKKINLTLIIIFMATLAFSQNNKNEKAIKGEKLFSATVTTEDHYTPGATMDINFVLNFETPDFEYGDFISLTFPDGITPNGSPTDPFCEVHEGQEPEYLNGVTGQEISWGANANYWGGIEIGVHSFIVNVTIDAGVTGDQIVNIMISGSEYGTPQGDIYITCTLHEMLSGSDLFVIAQEIEYTNYPLAQASNLPISAEVRNLAADLTDATDLVVTCELASYDEAVAISIPLLGGDSEILALPNLTLTTEGMNEIVFNATALDDPYAFNNSDTITIGVDSVYAHDDGGIAFAYGSGGITFSFGSVFDIVTEDDLTAVQIYLGETAPVGDDFSISVSPVTIGGLGVTFGTPVWESGDLTVEESMLDTWTTVNVPNADKLEVGQYAIMSHEHTSNSLELGFDGNPNGDMIMAFQDEVNYLEDETYGYPMLRLVLGAKNTTAVAETVTENEVSVYPNPTTGIVKITNAKNKHVAVYNMQGIKVIEIDNASSIETVDISNYAPGSYIIEVGTNRERVVLVK